MIQGEPGPLLLEMANTQFQRLIPLAGGAGALWYRPEGVPVSNVIHLTPVGIDGPGPITVDIARAEQRPFRVAGAWDGETLGVVWPDRVRGERGLVFARSAFFCP